MPSVFVSYRRDDAAQGARLIARELKAQFDRVFMDLDNIRAGAKWKHDLDTAIASCDVCVVVISPNWVGTTAKGDKRRIDDPGDWVRRELEVALRREVYVVPVLISRAQMPSELPESIAALENHQFFEVRDTRWDSDMRDLMSDIDDTLEAMELKSAEDETEVEPAQSREEASAGEAELESETGVEEIDQDLEVAERRERARDAVRQATKANPGDEPLAAEEPAALTSKKGNREILTEHPMWNQVHPDTRALLLANIESDEGIFCLSVGRVRKGECTVVTSNRLVRVWAGRSFFQRLGATPDYVEAKFQDIVSLSLSEAQGLFVFIAGATFGFNPHFDETYGADTRALAVHEITDFIENKTGKQAAKTEI
jgi:TIR domain